MGERFCEVGRGITLCYEEFGEEADPPILLVMGLATQMIGWHEDFCTELAGRGFRVVRFDNRDTGRSTHMDFAPPTTGQLLRRTTPPAQYTLADLAGDTVALMSRLELDPAHLVGASMGGPASSARSSPRAIAPPSSAGSRRRRSSSMAAETGSSAPRAGGRRRRRSPAPGSS